MFVVAGGRSKSSSLILDLNTFTWRNGPSFSSTVETSYAAQYGNTFVVVDESGIYEFDPENEEWITRPEALDRSRGDMTAIFVGDTIVNCS